MASCAAATGRAQVPLTLRGRGAAVVVVVVVVVAAVVVVVALVFSLRKSFENRFVIISSSNNK